MKKFFITAIVLIVTVFTMPAVRTFAAEKALEDIPTRGYTQSSKAYCLYEENDGEYVLTYINCNGTNQLYKSKEEFKHHESISEDGKTVFYKIDDTVYRYSYESGKRKKIYTVPENGSSRNRSVLVYSSPNGEYCAIRIEYSVAMDDNDIELILWHDGKTLSQTEKTTFGYVDSDTFYGVNDLGEVFYTIDKNLYIFDFNGKRLTEKIPDLESNNRKIYLNSRTYMLYCENEICFGEIGGERHKLSFSQVLRYNTVIAENGESFIAYNGEYVARYDIKSGKSKNILKISPEKYMENRFAFIKISSDMNEIAYINYSKKKLVRLSDWNAEKNRYNKRREIELNGTGREHISSYFPDMNIVLIGFADEKNNYCTADFNSGSLVTSEYWYYVDRFNRIIFQNGKYINFLDLEGNTTEVFDGVGITCDPWLSNGFFCFYSGGPEGDPYNYEGEYDLTYYYIDKNGKAVKWFEETKFMECHEICEDWEE